MPIKPSKNDPGEHKGCPVKGCGSMARSATQLNKHVLSQHPRSQAAKNIRGQ